MPTRSSSTSGPAARLRTYRAKRHFDRTPEPAGGPARRPRRQPSGGRSFVVQKHDASRLHYDFRLEHDGVLLSWAVPKGPSLDPSQKRLAMRTEDHPLEYGGFEGIIPEGEYGGGTVIVWDRGTWTPEGDPAAGLARGRLTFELHGERLHGTFHLVRTRSGGKGDSWLLFKSRDEAARPGREVTEEEASVLSGRTLDEVAASPEGVWHSGREPERGAKKRGRHGPGRGARRSAPGRAGGSQSGRRPDRQADLTGLIAALPEKLPGSVQLTNLDKVLYPGQGLTKGALVAYYAAVHERMLALVAGRPLTLVRCPEGRHKHCFYQKHAKPGMPDALRRVPIREESGAMAEYVAVEDLEGLLSLVQLGVLEIHTSGCRRDRVERPDQLVLDLDPDEALPWEAVVEAAFEVRALLEALELESFVKTTGGKGLHVVAPIARRSGWDEAKEFTHRIALAMTAARPDRYLAVMSKARRAGKIFIDYLRNGHGASAIAPYSTRAREGATVSAPLTWDELAAGVAPASFTVTTMADRLATDPWAGYGDVRQSITAAMMRRLERGRR